VLTAATRGVDPDSAESKALEAAHIQKHGQEPRASLRDVADHIEHVARVAGHDHVGIGSDFYGGTTPVGLEDVSKFPDLFAELLRRGWSEEDLRKLAGENVLRVLTRAEAVAAKLRRVRPASTATGQAGTKH
jgi:membrane dipeptidase